MKIFDSNLGNPSLSSTETLIINLFAKRVVRAKLGLVFFFAAVSTFGTIVSTKTFYKHQFTFDLAAGVQIDKTVIQISVGVGRGIFVQPFIRQVIIFHLVYNFYYFHSACFNAYAFAS